jgi:hypothetical protein
MRKRPIFVAYLSVFSCFSWLLAEHLGDLFEILGVDPGGAVRRNCSRYGRALFAWPSRTSVVASLYGAS